MANNSPDNSSKSGARSNQVIIVISSNKEIDLTLFLLPIHIHTHVCSFKQPCQSQKLSPIPQRTVSWTLARSGTLLGKKHNNMNTTLHVLPEKNKSRWKVCQSATTVV